MDKSTANFGAKLWMFVVASISSISILVGGIIYVNNSDNRSIRAIELIETNNANDKTRDDRMLRMEMKQNEADKTLTEIQTDLKYIIKGIEDIKSIEDKKK
jgi:hypothetical protein